MYRRTKRKIFRKMLQEIERIRMEFAKETFTMSGLSKQLQSNLQRIQNELHYSADLIVRQFAIGVKGNPKAAVVYIDGLVDKKQIEWSILQPLMAPPELITPLPTEDLLVQIAAKLISVGDANPTG